MKLAPGSRLGAYEITTLIGSGGMGEVYRAHDATLKRDVALKVLPETFAYDSDRLTRFRREAQVLASLNHPNIAQIYGLEGNPSCLVMELVEGEDLAGRIAHGPIPLDDALDIARQLADALDAAHERGIIHRDLKPANIKLRPDGVVKVLDFGLAKAVDGVADAGGAAADLGNSPTMTSPAMMTGVGVILGTAAYMSPEQARGRAVDKRSDIWAFGCVVYEMLTGHRAFDGADVSEMMASVIKSDVRWDALPAGTPAGIRRLLQRCLQKDPKLRLRDIGDARTEIGEAIAAPPSTGVPATAAPPLARGPRTLLLGAAALAIAALSASSAWLLKPEPALDSMSLSIVPARPWWSHQFPTISPDGTRVVFAAPNAAGVPQLWLRRLDEKTERPLDGTENPRWPFWSADGQSIAFFADNKLKRLDLNSESPQDVTDAPSVRGSGAWDAADIIYFGTAYSGLWKVPASGSAKEPLTTLDPNRGEVEHSSPSLLPDGRSFLYTIRSLQDGRSGIYTRLLSGGEPSLVAPVYSRAEYANGHLLFGRGVSLFAQKYDIGTGRLSGEEFRVVERVGMTGGNLSMYGFSSSSNGRLVYPEDPYAPVTQITIVDRQGRPLSSVGEPGEYISIALSPDGQQIALERRDPRDNSVDVWLVSDLSSPQSERFTTTTRAWRWSGVPRWMPSGAGGPRILFTEFADRYLIKRPGTTEGGSVIHRMPAGGGWPQDVAPDGQWIVTQVSDAATGSDIWLVPAAGDEKLTPYLTGPHNERSARVAPGGQRMAYTSDETGHNEVYVDSFPLKRNRTPISTGGGSMPVWNGTALYYIAKNGDLMVTNITLGQGGVQRSPPQALFRAPQLNSVLYERNQYGVIGNGERFVFNGVVRVEAPREIIVMTNWLSGRE
jgi:serine/threonine protein kinase